MFSIPLHKVYMINNSMPLKVQIAIIDLAAYMPYQWALLKTYANQDPLVAEKVQWLDPLHFFTLPAAEKEIEERSTFIQKYQLDQIDVLGISCYCWNREAIFKIAEIVKSVNPKCVVVAGGPELDYKNPYFFNENPQIDIIVKKDGEIPFQKILQNLLLEKTEFNNIPGLVLRGEEKSIDTGPAEVLQSFVISPWLSNKEYFVKWAKENITEVQTLRITMETNRGCPYSCTFCNWGSSTMSKLRLFDFENVKNEVELFAELGVNLLWIADANFGILPRDLQLCDTFEKFKNKFQQTEIVIFAAKNHPDRVSDIAISLFKSGLGSMFALGFQSTSMAALEGIGRQNIKFEKMVSISEKLKKENVPIVSQLILGCPGETFESWRKTVADTYSLGFVVQVFPFQVLLNTEAYEPAYREKWKMETSWGMTSEKRIYEYIVATSSFSLKEYVEMRLYYIIARCMFEDNLTIKTIKFFGINSAESLLILFDNFYHNFFNSSKFEKNARVFNELRENLLTTCSLRGQKSIDANLVDVYTLDSNVQFIHDRIFKAPGYAANLQFFLNQRKIEMAIEHQA